MSKLTLMLNARAHFTKAQAQHKCFVELVFILALWSSSLPCICAYACIVVVFITVMYMLVPRWWWKPGLRELASYLGLFFKIILSSFLVTVPCSCRGNVIVRFTWMFLWTMKMLNGDPGLSISLALIIVYLGDTVTQLSVIPFLLPGRGSH